MWECVLSLHRLQTRQDPAFFGEWRRDTWRALDPSVRLLLALNPPIGDFPDFLTPARFSRELGEGVDAMLSTPRERLRAEVAALPDLGTPRSWLESLADAEVETVKSLGQAFLAYHQQAVDPRWAAIVIDVEKERTRLANAFLRGGTEAILGSLSPNAYWASPVLHINYPVDRDLYLAGRGLTLIPAYFCWNNPVTLIDPVLPPVLVYPIRRHRLPGRTELAATSGDQALAALVGLTRAAILRTLEIPCTTTELGRRAGTSVTSASQHTAILRKAGLISTHRDGGTVLHRLTPLGAALLQQQTG